ncbi:MAG: SCO family protein [Polymorphobacter sp.]
MPTEARAGWRWLRIALWVAAVVAVAALLFGIQGANRQAADSNYAALFGGPFTLTDTQGRTVTESDLKGRPYAMFFGFTRCPEVCPTTLSSLTRLHQALGKDAERLRIVFVSVDPGHDTLASLGTYLASFPIPVTGLTGTPAQLAQIQKGYAVYVKKVPLEDGDYTIDHTAAVYLMDAQGRFVATLGYDEPETEKLKTLKRFLAQR